MDMCGYSVGYTGMMLNELAHTSGMWDNLGIGVSTYSKNRVNFDSVSIRNLQRIQANEY